MSDTLKEKGYVRDSWHDAICAREKSFPTGLQFEKIGIAIPHVDPENIVKPYIAIIKPKAPIDFAPMADMVDHPVHTELIINLGCAGSLKENVHIGDVVIADKTAAWRFDVPGWKRSFDSLYTSFGCSDEVVSIAKKISDPTMHIGGIVSADEFIRTKTQLKVIKRHYPEALCGEMEGAAVAGVCYAYHTPVSIIRSISDATLVQGDYRNFDFNLAKACENAAVLTEVLLRR